MATVATTLLRCQGSYGENLFTVTTAFEEGEYSFAELGCQEEVDDMSQQSETDATFLTRFYLFFYLRVHRICRNWRFFFLSTYFNKIYSYKRA